MQRQVNTLCCLLLAAIAVSALASVSAQGNKLEDYEYTFGAEDGFVDDYLQVFDYDGDYEYVDGEISVPVQSIPEPEQTVPANHLSCEGDGFEWVPLDPDMAAQWGDLEAYGAFTGASMAFGSNCSNLFEPGTNETSGCCSATSVDAFPWWQYDLGKSMMVKGVRVVPAVDDSVCCEDADCTIMKRCSVLRKENMVVTVGDFSLPEFYLTPEYEKLLKSMGSPSLVQPAVISELNEDSAICNVVTEFDLVAESGEMAASVACAGTEGFIKGQFVSLYLPTTEETSLALCGFEVCAKAYSP